MPGIFTLGEFAERFTDVVSESRYFSSDLGRLQALSSRRIRAAADAMWIHANMNGLDVNDVAEKLDEDTVIHVLLSLEASYDDEGKLASVEFQEFWDSIDEMGFSDSTRSHMQADLATRFLGKRRAAGRTVVDNTTGIWIFNLESR